MPEYGRIDAFLKGMATRPNLSKRNKESWVAKEQIDFGDSVWGYIGDQDECGNIHRDTAKVVFSADFITANQIDGVVNGVSISPVTFITSHLVTIGLVRDAYNSLDGVECILDPADTNNRTLLIRTKFADNVSSAVVTLGSSQPTVTITYSIDMVFLGVARHNQKDYTGIGYEVQDVVTVLMEGFIAVETSKAVNALTDAYVIITGANQKKFTDSNSDSAKTNAVFRGTLAAAGLVELEVNGLYKPNAEIAWA
jgi:hypothetical protein